MKYSKFLAGAIAAVALTAVSCEREVGPTGEDPSRPAPTEIIYDVDNATDDNLAIRWNAAPCIAAGAQSFTIQTCTDVEKGTSNYSTSSSKIVMVKDIKDGIGRYQFPDKSPYVSSYVRIRANYKNSVFTPWVWATTNGTPCLVETGFGMTDYTIAHPAVEFKSAGASDLTIKYDASNCSGADVIRLNLVDYNSRKVVEDITFTSAAAGEKKFEGLKVGKLYQIRMRQEHKGTAYPYISEWECASGMAKTEEGEDVESSVYQFGKGWVVVKGVAPTPRLKVAYSGLVVVEWSENGFTDKAADAGLKVDVAIWEDAACTKLHNGFHITTDIFNGQQACMSFANLEPDTSYWVTCQDVDSQLTSDPLEVHTAAFNIVRVTGTKAAAGENALAENFGQLFFGGNAADVAPGVSNATGLTTVYPTVGEWSSDAYADNNNHGFFNTLGNNGKVQNSRFNDWAIIHGKKDGTGDEVLGDACIRIASLQMGASSGIPIVFTPELTNLESMATVQLSIVVSTMAEKGAAKENTATDFQKLGIYTANGGTRNSSKGTSYAKLTDATVRQVAELDRPKGLDADGKACFGWESKSVILRNIAPGTRIGIGAIRPDGKTGNQRFLLREVVVKVLSYGAPTLTPPVLLSSEVSDVEFTVTFDKQEYAQSYSIAYQKCGESAWTEKTDLSEPTLTVTGLTEDTEYHVRCRAVAGEFYEESTIVIKTKEPEKIDLATPVVSVEAAVATADASWTAVEKATNYVVYVKKAGAADWTKAGETAETSYTITGLESNTEYVAGVKAIYKTNESAIGEKTFKTLDYVAPAEIATADDFVKWLTLGTPVAEAGTTLKLTADIDLTGKTLPEVENYAGTLDGNGKSIKNWTSSKAMFNKLTGTVKNLNIDASCKITPEDLVFGIIASNVEAGATISNITNKATITYSAAAITSSLCFGAIAGISNGAISNCTNEGTITVTSQDNIVGTAIGGIVGYQAAALTDCVNKGAINLNALYCSGKTAIGAAAAVPPTVGGIAGMGQAGFSATKCDNHGKVTIRLTAIEKANTTKISRTAYAGICGSPAGDITNCNNYGAIDVLSGTSTRVAQTAEHIVCVGGISGSEYLSAGQNVTNITGCTNEGDVTVDFDANYSNSAVGGVCGWPGVESAAQTVVTKNCVNKGNVTIKGNGYGRFGGVLGGAGNIEGCTNYGNVTSYIGYKGGAVGGVCGYRNYAMFIKNCANYGTVTNYYGDVTYTGSLIGAWGGQDFNSGEGCIAAGKVIVKAGTEGADLHKYTGMVLGRFNGDKNNTLGSEAKPIKVSGTIEFGDESVTLTSDNYKNYCTGTERATNLSTGEASKRTLYVQFGE